MIAIDAQDSAADLMLAAQQAVQVRQGRLPPPTPSSLSLLTH